jgi:hypothetical protein
VPDGFECRLIYSAIPNDADSVVVRISPHFEQGPTQQHTNWQASPDK